MADLPGKPDGSEPIRLLWLIDSLTMGGAETLTASLAATADPSRLEVVVCCLKSIGGNPLEAEVRASGVRFVNLGARALRDAPAFLRLLRLVRRERIDLIHAHLRSASIWGALASRVTAVPMVASIHVGPGERSKGGVEGAKETMRCLFLDRWAHAVVAVSAWVRDSWHARGRIHAGRFRVVHNGIDTNGHAPLPPDGRAALRLELGFPHDALVCTSVSVLRGGKGTGLLLDAAPSILESHPRARFLVVGEGPEREALEARCREEGLAGAFHWAGWRRDVPRLLGGSDLFLHPSMEDAFPTAVLEAMASSVPQVAARTGGVPEMVVEGVTGHLFEPGDADALARAVVALAGDAAAREEMGRASARTARERFSTSAWLGRLESLYLRALEEARG